MHHSYKVKDGSSNLPEGTMSLEQVNIGDSWTIADDGRIGCRKCWQYTWAHTHRCWIPAYRNTGKYITVVAPQLVCELSQIYYDVFMAKFK